MPYASKVEDAYCSECGNDEVYMDLKEEASLYKVGAYCHSCDRDYGVLDVVSRSDIDQLDDASEAAEEIVYRFFE